MNLTPNKNFLFDKNIVVTFIMMIFCHFATAQELPQRADVLKAMELANDYFIAKYPEPGAPTYVKKYRPSNLWTRGVFFEGLYSLAELERINGGEKYETYHKYIMDWGNAHKWTPRNGVTTRDADDYCCSQTYLDIFMSQSPNDQTFMIPTKQCLDNLMSLEESKGDWTWVDAIQMGLPVFTKLARHYYFEGDYAEAKKLLDWGWKMYECSRNEIAGGLYNAEDGLWWRDKDFVATYKEPNGEDCYWSRGNGWVYAALVRAMESSLVSENSTAPHYLEPLDEYKWKQFFIDSHYDSYKADFVAMSEALLKCQRGDNFWNVSLHDESNFGGKELTGTALFVYGMAWGVRHGILPRETYLPVVVRTWESMVKDCLHDNGFLGYVQGTGKEPKDSQPVGYDIEPDFDDFGLGCFLLAGSEVYRLQRD